MIVTVFRSRLRPEHEREYHEWGERMEALARAMPGFLSFKTFYARDGERVSIVEFEDEVTHAAWRSHPEHREAQRLGREKFYSEFRIQVCADPREIRFNGQRTSNP
ncbi:MAG TPA: antibiotic biosynthesis monooxygenase [Thermodesulfobacteriota bacterium]|nr:antibiotic biosynthesis monooxygenase [Thermodesulfobacteriota bacterium]